MGRAPPIIGISSTATPSSAGCSFVRSSQKCLPPLSTTRGRERTEARKEARPPLFSSSLSLSLDSEQCVSTSVSSFSSVAPIPLLQRLARVSSRGSSTLFSPCFRLGCLATRRERRFSVVIVNQPTYFNKVARPFLPLSSGKKGKPTTGGLTRIYRNTIYRLTRIRRYGNRIPVETLPFGGNELIHRLVEQTSYTFIESSVRTAAILSSLKPVRFPLTLGDRRFVTLFKVH